MFVLPQILLVGSGIADRTSFSVKTNVADLHRSTGERIFVDGVVSGEINGRVNGIFRGFVEGDAELRVLSGSCIPAPAEESAVEGSSADAEATPEAAPDTPQEAVQDTPPDILPDSPAPAIEEIKEETI